MTVTPWYLMLLVTLHLYMIALLENDLTTDPCLDLGFIFNERLIHRVFVIALAHCTQGFFSQ